MKFFDGVIIMFFLRTLRRRGEISVTMMTMLTEEDDWSVESRIRKMARDAREINEK